MSSSRKSSPRTSRAGGRVLLAATSLLCVAGTASSQEIESEILTTESGERILRQELIVPAPLEEVWAAYTTAEGLRAWAVPVAEVDFRIGGTWRSHYTPGAEIGDPGTITVRYVNFVPHRLLTLQSELPEQFPPVIREAEDRLYNIVEFETIDDRRTRLISWGVGYGASDEWDDFMGFFVEGNEASFRELIRRFQEGPRDWEP